MHYGYWLPIFGGWLRNVEDEQMPPTWEYVSELAIRAEKIGYDLTLVAELYLNDIKGMSAPSLDAWSTAAALAAVTHSQEIMVAVRPTFHNPAQLAKHAANIDHISKGRLSLNVVSSWWADEAAKYGIHFERHDDRYARTDEWLTVLNGVWNADHFSHDGGFYKVDDNVLQPKPVPNRPRPPIYAGGESEAARNLIARTCDGYVMHGDPPEKIGARIADMRERRQRIAPKLAPLTFGVAAYSIVRDTGDLAQQELARITDVKQSAAIYAKTISSGWRARSSSSMSLSKITPCRIVVFDPGWLEHQMKFESELPNSRKLVQISCCCNALRKWRKWSALPIESSAKWPIG